MRVRCGILLAVVLVGGCADAGGVGGGPPATAGADDIALPTLAASPASTATAVPRTAAPVMLETTVTADQVSLTILGPVRRGQTAMVKARTAINAECFITVTSSMGPVAGLDAKATDGAGDVSWSWTVDASAAPGQWPVEVTCITSSSSGTRATARDVLRVEP